MITWVTVSMLLQEDSVATGIPEPGVRISVWMIGMFLLAIGGTMVYFRMKELSGNEKWGGSRD